MGYCIHLYASANIIQAGDNQTLLSPFTPRPERSVCAGIQKGVIVNANPAIPQFTEG